jgi:hypothetical protein
MREGAPKVLFAEDEFCGELVIIPIGLLSNLDL